MAPRDKYPKYLLGIKVNSHKVKNYTCLICPQTFEKSWEDHLENERHLAILEYYRRSFADSRDFVTCILCNKSGNPESAISHAITHNLIPWVRPTNEHRLLFENFISKLGNKYYCHLCQVKLPFWFSALSHIDYGQHQLQKSKIDTIGMTELPPPITYQLLYHNHVFPKSSDTFLCMVCNTEESSAYVLKHIKLDSHEESEKILGKKFRSDGLRKLKSRVFNRARIADRSRSNDNDNQTKNSTVHFDGNVTEPKDRDNQKSSLRKQTTANKENYDMRQLQIEDHKSTDKKSSRDMNSVDELPEGIVKWYRGYFKCTVCDCRLKPTSITKHCGIENHQRELEDHNAQLIKTSNESKKIQSILEDARKKSVYEDRYSDFYLIEDSYDGNRDLRCLLEVPRGRSFVSHKVVIHCRACKCKITKADLKKHLSSKSHKKML